VLNYDEQSNDWNYKSKPTENFSIEQNIERLSARYTEHPEFTIREDVQADFENTKLRLSNPRSTQNTILSGLLTPPPERNNSNSKLKNQEDDEVIELLDNIDCKYWKEFESWKKLIMAINSTFTDKKEAQQLSIYYSKKAVELLKYDNYDEEAVLKLLEAPHDKVSIGTICYYSKLSNTENFYKIKAKYQVDFENSDLDIAKTYIKLISDNIKIVDKTVYIYEGRLWAVDEDKKKLQKNIVTTLLDFYDKCNSRYIGLIKNTENSDSKYENYIKTLKQILFDLLSVPSAPPLSGLSFFVSLGFSSAGLSSSSASMMLPASSTRMSPRPPPFFSSGFLSLSDSPGLSFFCSSVKEPSSSSFTSMSVLSSMPTFKLNNPSICRYF
jgi:hypothetical protein